VALTLLLTACGGDDDDSAGSAGATEDGNGASNSGRTAERAQPEGQTLPANNTWAATAKPELSEVGVYESADATEPTTTLANPNEVGAPLTFLVDGTEVDGERIQVLLPTPPNGSTGWVNASDVTLQANPYRIRVELGAHRLTVTNAGEVAVDTPVAVGAQGMETPTGTYFLKELLQPPDPNGVYGVYAYIISGYTTNPDVAAQFGREGIIGIHGTNQPELLGTDVSHGCIRVANDVITEMVSYLPLGTPVDIQA
jgi:lipoprotein-anchoring transpeptidase ErfK/SrfK